MQTLQQKQVEGIFRISELVGQEGAAKNASRDIRRKLLKRSMWPPLCEAEVRMWSNRDKTMKSRKIAFLLPRELLLTMAEVGDYDTVACTEGLDGYNRKRHE